MRSPRRWVDRHPRLVLWALLAPVMAAALLATTHGRDLPAAQVGWMLAGVVATAGLCAWVISEG